MTPFVHGALFWGGIGLVSIPIIIHILNRRRFRPMEWAAMEFLLEALRRNRRRIRIEHLILLLLRILLIALLVAALARPHLSRDRFGFLGGPFRSEERIFVLDDSLSMGHVEGGSSALERGGEAVLRTVEKVALDGGRDPVRVLRASSPRSPLFTSETPDASQVEGLREQLRPEALRPTATRLDLIATLDDLAATARPERGRSVTIVTDLSRNDWTDPRGEPLEALRRALERVAGDAENPTRLIVVDAGADSRENVAVTGFGVRAANAIAGIPVDLEIEISNFGATAVHDLGTRLRTSTSVVPGPRVATIAPGDSVSVEVPHIFHEVGSQWIRAEIEGAGDGLTADDGRDLAVEVLEAVEVLVVDGEPSGDYGEGESDFLLQALRPEGDLSSGLSPRLVIESSLPAESLSSYGAIFLANVARLPEDFIARLARHVRSGGGLIIFPGDQVDPNVYANLLGDGTPEAPGAGLLPATIGDLGDLGGDVTRPAHISPTLSHPAFELLSGGGEELLRLVDVYRFHKLTPLEDAVVGATLTDADASPLFVQGAVGEGRVVLFSVPADLEWTTWPRNPSYLPVLLELTHGVALRRGASWNILAAAPAEVPIDLSEHQREARLRGPDYPSTPQRVLLATQPAPQRAAGTEGDAESAQAPVRPEGDDAVASGDGESVRDEATESATPVAADFRIRVDDTRQGGVYTLLLKTVDGSEEVRHIAVGPEAAESDLRPLEDGELERSYEGVPLEVVRDAASVADSDSGRFEIADALLALFLLVLLVEGTFAWWAAHHRRSGAGTAGGAS